MMTTVFAQIPLSAADIATGYNTIYVPGVKYPLPATTIDWFDLDELQKRITHTVLPKMNFNRHFPLEVVYAPKSLWGA